MGEYARAPYGGAGKVAVQFRSISARLSATTAVVVAVVVATFLAIEVRALSTWSASEAEARTQATRAGKDAVATALVRSTAMAAQTALFDRNYTYLQSLAETAAGVDPDVRFVVLADDTGQLVADSRGDRAGRPTRLGDDDLSARLRAGASCPRAVDPTDPSLAVYAETVRQPGEERRAIGQLRVGLSMRSLELQLTQARAASELRARRAVELTGIVAMGLVLFGAGLAILQGMRVARPVVELGALARRIADGELTLRVPARGKDELARLAADFNHLADRISALLQEGAARAALDKELELARAVQESLLPVPALVERPGLRLCGRVAAASECGGDFWAHRDAGQGRALVLIGDVVGHGVPAALITAAVVAACELIPDASSPDRVLAHLSRAVLHAGRGRFTASAFAAVIDPAAGTLHFSSAGHPTPLLFRSGAGAEALIDLGPLLGEEPSPEFGLQATRVAAGDVVAWYTDGLTEAEDPAGVPFGERRLRQSLGKRVHAGLGPAEVRDAVLADLHVHRSGARIEDDATIVIAQIVG